MPIELRWIVSTAASSLHAARAAGGPSSDGRLAAAIAVPAQALADALAHLSLTPEQFFEHALPLSVKFDAPRAVGDRRARKAAGAKGSRRGRPRDRRAV